MSAKRVKPRRKLPKILPVDVLTAILDQVPETNFEIRDAAMCELFYSSGLRLSELANLNYADLDLDDQEVRVVDGKGGKHRIVPLGSCAREALLLWNKVRANMVDLDRKAVFISRFGTRLSNRQIRDRVKAYGNKLGLNINLYPHKLRHSMATQVLESSQDIRAVQELLGHADISTTQIYTQVDFAYLCRVFDKYHPRAKKKKDDST